MVPLRSYSVSSVLTVLDPLYQKPSYTAGSNHHHQTNEKYRIPQAQLPHSQHHCDMGGCGFTSPLSPTGSCLDGNCLSCGPQLSSSSELGGVHPLCEDPQGGEEGRIWSDLEMTCFSESDNENFDGDRDSKNYFKPENLESCGVGLGSNGFDSHGGGVTMCINSMCLDSCSGDTYQTLEDGNTGKVIGNDVGDGTADNGSEVAGSATNKHTDRNGMKFKSADCTGIRHKPIDYNITVIQEIGSCRHMSDDSDSANDDDRASTEEVKDEGSTEPQVVQDPSCCFNPSSLSATDDSGFASSDGVLS